MEDLSLSSKRPEQCDDVGHRQQGRRRRSWLPCLLSCLLLVALGLTIGIPKVNSDGRRYFAMALSLAQDGDFDLANQRSAAGGARLRNGRWVTPYAPGFAVFYYPMLKAALVLAAHKGAVADLSLIPAVGDGAMAHEALAVLAGSVVFGLVALWLSCRAAQAVTSGWSAAAATLTTFAGTQLVGYCLFWPSFAHALDAALVSVGLWSLIRATSGKHGAARSHCLCGFALGAAATVRMVNVSTLAGAVLVVLLGSARIRARIGRAAVVVVGSLPPLALLAVYQFSVYGRLLGGGYERAIVLWPKHFLSPLLYRPHGLLHWSPFVLMAGAGWFMIERRDLRLACVVPFAATLLALGFYVHHQEGAYYGCRYLVQFQLVFSLGLAAFLSRTRRLQRGRRIVARAATWVAAAYSLALVPLAWWPTPRAPLADGSQELDPNRILGRFMHAVWSDARARGTGSASVTELLPRPPSITPTSLLLGRWGPSVEPWLATMESVLGSGRPPAPARRLPVIASTKYSLVCECWPAAPGWPTVASFRLPRGASSARSESWTLRAGSRDVTCAMTRRERRPAWSAGNVGVFADMVEDTTFIHVLHSRPSSPETLVWTAGPGTEQLPVPRAPCDEQLRVLCLMWAFSGTAVMEPGAPEIQHPRGLHRFPGQIGDAAAYESVSDTGWTWEPDDLPTGPSVLCIALGWRGTRELRAECADGRTATIGSLDQPCPRIEPEGWLLLTGSDTGGGWMRGACFLVGGEGTRTHPLTLSLAAETESETSVRVLRYGDAWRRERRARFPKAWGYLQKPTR